MYIQNCCITEIFDKPGLVQIDGACPKCGKHWKLCLTQKNLEDYIGGKLVQEAFPAMNADDMELLISGTCKECWDDLSRKESNGV